MLNLFDVERCKMGTFAVVKIDKNPSAFIVDRFDLAQFKTSIMANQNLHPNLHFLIPLVNGHEISLIHV